MRGDTAEINYPLAEYATDPVLQVGACTSRVGCVGCVGCAGACGLGSSGMSSVGLTCCELDLGTGKRDRRGPTATGRWHYPGPRSNRPAPPLHVEELYASCAFCTSRGATAPVPPLVCRPCWFIKLRNGLCILMQTLMPSRDDMRVRAWGPSSPATCQAKLPRRQLRYSLCYCRALHPSNEQWRVARFRPSALCSASAARPSERSSQRHDYHGDTCYPI